jgi:integrase
MEDEIESKALNNLSLMKMSDYMDKWMKVNKPLLAATTVKTYNLYIEHHFKPYFGAKKVNQITEMNIMEYIEKKLVAEKLSSTTVRKHFFTLKKMFYDAMKTKSPCNEITAPKPGDFKATIPTEQEFENICAVFKTFGVEDEAIILLAGQCGLRRGEIFALKWDDLDEKLGTLRIDEAVALEEKGYKFELKDPKSHNGIRTIVIPDYLKNLLIDIKKTIPPSKTRRKGRKRDDPDKTEKVIFRYEIFTYNPHTFTKLYARTIKDEKYKLPQVRFHDLRHYHASLLYKYQVPDQYAAERLGHDITVLKKIYQHLGLEEKLNLDEKIKGMFKNE